ncbi:cysteine desulfurase family protein [Streptococcus zalophi]|uniref:cysteine desulfurase n=1 Tax=Streptococcus zalophi TaxID=640031 RepID=A0A934P9I1_9STRE|nr:cysteine desulfurase family protein [Streptococcus zalophi]MBJ8349416.1 cysteine desulfurase [Streptococcus zalophi]MCR8967389.1 cysteine desulfurase [Streptococcus zalophi]
MPYFDNASTTFLTPSVIEQMTKVMNSTPANPSSIHSYGRKSNQLLREAKEKIARLLNVNAKNIILTSGATESNNTAIKGYALANENKGKHLITTSVEHHSVFDVMSYLEKNHGFEVTYLSPIDGTISANQVKDALRDDTILVSIMHTNNETGHQFPIKAIGDLLKNHQAVFHVDAVQAIGKVPVYPEELGIDLMSLSAHKFHGPTGIGILYSKPLHMIKLLHGGDQEDKKRAGTENLVGLVGMAQALEDSLSHQKENYQHVVALRDLFLKQLDGVTYYLNSPKDGLAHIINIGFPKINNSILLTQLDLAGFAVSTGSACTAGNVEPSHVLAAFYGKDSEKLKESIRISFSEFNTTEEVIQLTTKLKEIIGK